MKTDKIKIPMSKKTVIYGINPVLEALRAGTARLVYVSASRKKGLKEIIDEAEAKGVKVEVMHDPLYFDSRFPKGHQGVAAEGSRAPFLSIDELMEQAARSDRLPLYIVLDEIEDPRNLGAIIRTAEASGAAGVITQERRSAGLTPEAVKASAGASEHIAFCVVTNIKNALRSLREEGITIAGAENLPEAMPVWDAGLSLPLALVVGSEGRGLRRTVRDMCDILVRLPLQGKVGSLNTSVAAGAVIFEILRQNR
jgi:23S rRNA (guanosine2251-2'-O)-methyltransferase